MKMLTKILFVVLILAFAFLIYADVFYNECNNIKLLGYGNFVLGGLMVLIIYWYADLTNKLRKIEQHRLDKEKTPNVSINVQLNIEKKDDIYLVLLNKEVVNSTLLMIKYDIFEKQNKLTLQKGEIDYPSYNGTKYWNLNYKQCKSGHFNWKKGLTILSTYEKELEKQIKNLYGDTVSDKNENEILKEIIEEKFEIEINSIQDIKLRLYLEYFCCTKDGKYSYYPEQIWDFKILSDTQEKKLVALVTNEKPYWEYEELPDWILNNEKINKIVHLPNKNTKKKNKNSS